jgi:hypothetical protein
MKHFDYANVKKLVHDQDIQRLLYIDRNYRELMVILLRDEYLEIDESIKVPFFAQTRDYLGARMRDDSEDLWIVKPLREEDLLRSEMASICFFVDFFTDTLSAPFVVTRIGGKLHKATKLIKRSEQLSGANYTEHKRMKEQLLLDIVNRWIYFDEDRNPNNYMILYNSRNEEIIVAIDFGNVDLLSTEMKIEGIPDRFGWERHEKTRYLTPLKVENFVEYDLDFFNIRFKSFQRLNRSTLNKLCSAVLRFNEDSEALGERITDNILKRVRYVFEYFSSHISLKVPEGKNEKYREFGKTFSKLYVDD